MKTLNGLNGKAVNMLDFEYEEAEAVNSRVLLTVKDILANHPCPKRALTAEELVVFVTGDTRYKAEDFFTADLPGMGSA